MLNNANLSALPSPILFNFFTLNDFLKKKLAYFENVINTNSMPLEAIEILIQNIIDDILKKTGIILNNNTHSLTGYTSYYDFFQDLSKINNLYIRKTTNKDLELIQWALQHSLKNPVIAHFIYLHEQYFRKILPEEQLFFLLDEAIKLGNISSAFIFFLQHQILKNKNQAKQTAYWVVQAFFKKNKIELYDNDQQHFWYLLFSLNANNALIFYKTLRSTGKIHLLNNHDYQMLLYLIQNPEPYIAYRILEYQKPFTSDTFAINSQIFSFAFIKNPSDQTLVNSFLHDLTKNVIKLAHDTQQTQNTSKKTIANQLNEIFNSVSLLLNNHKLTSFIHYELLNQDNFLLKILFTIKYQSLIFDNNYYELIKYFSQQKLALLVKWNHIFLKWDHHVLNYFLLLNDPITDVTICQPIAKHFKKFKDLTITSKEEFEFIIWLLNNERLSPEAISNAFILMKHLSILFLQKYYFISTCYEISYLLPDLLIRDPNQIIDLVFQLKKPYEKIEINLQLDATIADLQTFQQRYNYARNPQFSKLTLHDLIPSAANRAKVVNGNPLVYTNNTPPRYCFFYDGTPFTKICRDDDHLCSLNFLEKKNER